MYKRFITKAFRCFLLISFLLSSLSIISPTKIHANTIITSNVSTISANTSDNIPVTKVTLSEKTQNIEVGATVQLTATVEPSNATDKRVFWTSSNPNVVAVNNGVIVAISSGYSFITATSADGIHSDVCVVWVTPAIVRVTKFNVSPIKKSMYIGDTTNLTTTIEPANATNKTVYWSSSNPEVATVANGVVTAVGQGTTTITATLYDYKLPINYGDSYTYPGDKILTTTCVITVSKKSATPTPSVTPKPTAKPTPTPTPKPTTTPTPIPKIYTVYFDANGGSVGTTYKTITRNQAYGTLPVPTKDSYRFLGWYTGRTGGDKINSSTIFTSYSDIVLYARWLRIPIQVTGLKISNNTSNSIKLSWDNQNDVSGYEILRKNSSNDNFILVNTVNTNSYTDTGLSSGTDYYYQVRAYVVNGAEILYGSYSSTAIASTTKKESKPVLSIKPTGKKKKSVKLTWKYDGKADYYQIQIKTKKGIYKTIKLSASKGCQYTFSKLTKGVNYTFRVRAFNVSEDNKRVYSEYSNLVKYKYK